METLRIEQIYQAPLSLVWIAISDRKRMKEWYFDFTDDFNLKIDQEFEWKAGPSDGKIWLHKGKILEVHPENKLVYSWEYPGYSGLSKVSWEIRALNENSTKLILSHEFSIPFDPNEEELKMENFRIGWNHILQVALQKYLN